MLKYLAGWCFSLLLLVFQPALAASADVGWKLVNRNDGVFVYMARMPNERLKTFRGVTTIDLDDFDAIAAFMDDYEFVTSWLHMVSTIDNIARTTPDDRLVYVTTRLPWPVNNRDAVLHVGLTQDPETYAVRMPMVDVPGVLPEKEGYVRMLKFDGYFMFQPLEKGRVVVTLQVILDPGGYIPDWMANLILMDIPYYSLKKLRAVANDPRFRDHHLNYFKTPPWWVNTTAPMPAVGGPSP